MFVGAVFSPKTLAPLVTSDINVYAPLVDGGKFVVNRTFTGRFVAHSRILVAQIALVGTCTRIQLMLLVGTVLVCGPVLVTCGITVTIKLLVPDWVVNEFDTTVVNWTFSPGVFAGTGQVIIPPLLIVAPT